MRHPGIGLKPLMALMLAVLLGALALGMALTATYLTRQHGRTERTRWVRALVGQAAAQIEIDCPGLPEGRSCDALQPILQGIARAEPSISFVSLQGPDGFSRQVGRLAGGPQVVVELPWASWSLRVVHAWDDTEKWAASVGRHLLLYGLTLVVGLLLFGWLMMVRLFVRPVDRLLLSADRISAGDWEFFRGAEEGSEMGRLGWAFSRMASRIEQDRRQLEGQIGQLTDLNQRLHKTQEGLIRSEKLASVGKLAAGLAHEVGNPLSAVLGYVGMLRTESIPAPEQGEMLGRVEKELHRIDSIIKDLLSYSRSSRARVAEVTPRELVESAMLLIRPQKKYKSTSVELALDASLPRVKADPEQIRQVLVNLLLNALDAVPEGGRIWVHACTAEFTPGGEITWNRSSPGPLPSFLSPGALHVPSPPLDWQVGAMGREWVIFSVVDSGCGIPAENLALVFEAFFTTKESGQGTGLGLAICQAVIHAVGGAIWACSEPGVGTRFSFTLPSSGPS